MRPSYLLVVNPKSGRGRGLERAEALGAALSEAHDVELVKTERRGFATDIVSERARDFERVIAIGGDGTLNEVLTGLMRLDVDRAELPALGFLPSGTANAAAPAFGFGATPTEVADALPRAEARPVDVGVVSYGGTERPFLLWLGAGYDAVVIDALNRRRSGPMGIAGIMRKSPSIVRAVHRYPAPRIRVAVNDTDEGEGASVFLANVADMAFGGTAVDSADPFDGRLDVLIFPRGGTARVAGLALRMVVSSLGRAKGVEHRVATRVRLEADGDVPFQLDGEPVGTLPADVRLEPGAVRLLLT